MRRYNRDAPYRDDHARSKRAKMARPKDLLTWFLSGIREEMPDRLHTRGVWREYVTDVAGGGGSVLGSPRWSDPFRRFLEDPPTGTEVSEYEGHRSLGEHYRTPMRAALARLAGRGKDTDPSPFMAHALYLTALNDGDWQFVCSQMYIVEPVREPYIEAALRRLWNCYLEEPPVNYYQKDEQVA